MYVVQCSDKTLYTGVTTEISRRVREHNSPDKGAKYTKPRQPVSLLYWTSYPDRSSALKAEHAFKKLRRKQKDEIISSRLLQLLNETS